jgi:hypothetical protein
MLAYADYGRPACNRHEKRERFGNALVPLSRVEQLIGHEAADRGDVATTIEGVYDFAI